MVKIQGKPLHVASEEGLILLDGGPGLAITMTPIAAVQTAEAILSVAASLKIDHEQKA